MHTLFNPENKFWNFVGKIADVACMSILWFLTSLPIITVGASTAAFYSFTLDAVQDTEGQVWRSYFSALRKNFKKATLIWLLQMVMFLIMAVNLYAAWNFFLTSNVVGITVLSLAFFGMLVLVCTGLYVYPILAYYDFTIKKVIVDSFIMAVSNLHVTISIILLNFVACVCIYYLSGLFCFWIGLSIFFSSYFIWGLFMKYAGVKVERKKKPRKKLDPYI